jgi:hypothetical protein
MCLCILHKLVCLCHLEFTYFQYSSTFFRDVFVIKFFAIIIVSEFLLTNVEVKNKKKKKFCTCHVQEVKQNSFTLLKRYLPTFKDGKSSNQVCLHFFKKSISPLSNSNILHLHLIFCISNEKSLC